MEGNSKFLAGLLAGAAAGAALAIFLKSDTGKKVVAGVKDAASKLVDEIQEKVRDMADETGKKSSNEMG
jgi:gas vesicle protein